MTRDYRIGKICRYIKILAVTLLIFSPLSNAAWVDNSPELARGDVTDFALAPSLPARVIATVEGAAQRGVWTSFNSGTNLTWTRQLSTTGQSYNGAAIKADDFLFMLAGVLNGEIEISADGFNSRGPTTNSASHISWIIEYSLSAFDTVYAAGNSGGLTGGTLQKSIDAGNSWIAYDVGGDPNPPLFSLAIAPTDANTVYVGAQPDGASNGLYKTTDGAVNWTYLPALNFTQVDAVAVDPVDLDYVYAGTEVSGQIQRSSDGGVSWAVVHDPDPNNGGVTGFTRVLGLAINPADRRIIYAVGGSGSIKVIASTDCGVSWANVDSTGLVSGLPDKVVIDSINNYVMVHTNTGFMYREALLTTATGDCIANPGAPDGDGGAFDYLLLGMLMLIGVVRYRTRRISA